jgi:hypothetical protein
MNTHIPAGQESPLLSDEERYTRTDESFSLGRATVLALGITPVMGVAILGLYCLIWGTDSLLTGTMYFRYVYIVLPVMLLSVLVHEGLHWLGYVAFARLPWKSVRLGFNLRSLSAYVHAEAPVKISAYKGLIALPGIILGMLPAFAGITLGYGMLTLYGFIMLAGASGDLVILWKIRHVSPGSFVADHPTRAGCWVLTEKKEQDGHS